MLALRAFIPVSGTKNVRRLCSGAAVVYRPATSTVCSTSELVDDDVAGPGGIEKIHRVSPY